MRYPFKSSAKKIQGLQKPATFNGNKQTFRKTTQVFLKYFMFKVLLLSFIEHGQVVQTGSRSGVLEPQHFVFDRGKHSSLPAGKTTTKVDDWNISTGQIRISFLNIVDTNNWLSKFDPKSKQMPGRHFIIGWKCYWPNPSYRFHQLT